jgi:hypothetical protein
MTSRMFSIPVTNKISLSNPRPKPGKQLWVQKQNKLRMKNVDGDGLKKIGRNKSSLCLYIRVGCVLIYVHTYMHICVCVHYRRVAVCHIFGGRCTRRSPQFPVPFPKNSMDKYSKQSVSCLVRGALRQRQWRCKR